ncbi:MAG: hypothetical protein JNJ59_18850, partial [Deltaproteobacteria bacterium]|nr:hypothetical protein [Deltaproteobacteria bacterium]
MNSHFLRRTFRTARHARLMPVALALTALTPLACDEPFETEPNYQYGDFGTEVYQMLHDEFLWSGTAGEGAARSAAFAQHQPDVIWALNAMTQGKVSTGMLPLMERFL